MRDVRKDITQMIAKKMREKKTVRVIQRQHNFDFRTTRAELQVPVRSSLGIHLGTSLRSLMGVRTPSKLPNMEERPKLKSITKNSMAHTCEPGISITASVNTMKASPVPEALWGRMIKEPTNNEDVSTGYAY